MADKIDKKIKCRLKSNREYGTSLRRGVSGTVYILSVVFKTLVAADDLKGLQDKKNDQYEPYLETIK